ncbi:chemerin-like receptor 2 [Littorina saxatilis]|uniref:G-protein coupled receptors family 1 profile domain-containing protein n=1 Tax=Littorina saxatilis TaxID=31220 RepID=A0AAN9C0Y4_9CAEN
MADRNGSEAGPETRPDLFKWHGTEVIFIPIMLATGILGNALVLYITHFRWKNSIFSFFIKVLAWLDMSNLVLAMPMLMVITVHDDTPHFLPLCGCTSFVALFTAIASACVLVVIAANRFRKLYQPQRSQVTLPLAKKLTIGCFLFGALTSVPTVWIFGKDTVSYNADVSPVYISYCFIKHDAELALLVTWAVVMGATFLSVTVSLVVLYGFTIRALRQHDKRISTMMRRPSAVSNNSKNISKKHTLVFIAVTVVFFVTYSPYFVTVILLLVNRSIESAMGPVAKAFFDLARLFPMLSNVSNPIIYSFTSDRFRSECHKVFKLRPCMRLLNLQRKDSITTSHEMSQSEET